MIISPLMTRLDEYETDFAMGDKDVQMVGDEGAEAKAPTQDEIPDEKKKTLDVGMF